MKSAKPTTDVVVGVKDLTKKYNKVEALKGVSFNVYKNEIFGILGPNGAGKTTTIEVLEGMISPTSGTANVCGIDILKKPKEVHQKIGVQPQASAFIEKMHLDELLDIYSRLYGYKLDVKSLLAEFDLEDCMKREPKKLSGGQKQRFSIAVALVNDPDILFLDEPSTGLDPNSRRSLWDIIRKLRDSGKTVILTTHYMEEAEILCDRVAVMVSGRIVGIDSPSSLVDQLLSRGFKPNREVKQATLEDVFVDLTGKTIEEIHEETISN